MLDCGIRKRGKMINFEKLIFKFGVSSVIRARYYV